VKLCPSCGERKARDEFYEEPSDTVTGLSALCRSCIAAKRAKPKKRSVVGWHVVSPAGLVGTVLNVREDTGEIAIRFKGSRTVVLPMREARGG
jgi:hypothetical protein